MNPLLTLHPYHACVLLDGEFEWPRMHDVVSAIETAIDFYSYDHIEIRIRSLGGSNGCLRYLLDSMEAWRGRGVRFGTRALGRTSSAAALLVALGDERVADPGVTLRFHGSSMYRRGDINSAEAGALRDKLSSADQRMVERLVERALATTHEPGRHFAEDSDSAVLEGLCAGAGEVPFSDPDERLTTLATAIGAVVDQAVAERDRDSLGRLYARLCQIDRPVSASLAQTLRLIDRVGATSSASPGVPVHPGSLPLFAAPTDELPVDALTRHVLVLGDDPVAATRYCLAPLLAALAAAPEGDVGTVLVLDPCPELGALLQTLPREARLEFPPGPLVLDLMSASHELASALEQGRWIRAAVLILERTLSLHPRSPARVLSDTSGQIVDLVIREGASRAVSAVAFVLMLASEPFHRRDAWLRGDGSDPWLCTDLIEHARGGEGEHGPNILSLASWLLAVAPARILTAAWEAFAGLGSEEWDVHRGLFDTGHTLSRAGDHTRAVLAVAQAVLSPFAAPGARTSLYFGCEPGLKQGDPLDLDAIVSGSTQARFLLHVPRNDSSGVLLATALKECFFEAVLNAREPDSPGPTSPLRGYVARSFERYVSAVDRRFLDCAPRAGAFAVLASRSLSAIEHAIPDFPGAEQLLSHALSACGTKVFLRTTDPRTQDLVASLAPRRPGLPGLLAVRPLSGLAPNESYVARPDGPFERRRFAPWTCAELSVVPSGDSG